MTNSTTPVALRHFYAGDYFQRLGRVLRRHVPLVALTALYWLAAYLAADHHGVGGQLSVSYYLKVLPNTVAAYLLFLAFAYVVHVMLFLRPERLLNHMVRDVWSRWLVAERVFGTIILVILLEIFFSIFTSMKSLIPVMNPFAWDRSFAEWDRILHGGFDAWLLLDPILGYPWVTTAVNFLYQCWLFLVFGFLVWQAFVTSDQRLRLQFFLSFFLVWILLGNLLATLLSSAGPAYFGAVTGAESPYRGLLEYLRLANETGQVWALELHEALWTSYVEGGDQLGAGISAMPSIHVATCMLFALAASRMGRLPGLLFWAYLAAVMLGSVHLAWHYAIDGYLSIVLTAAIWFAVGWTLERFPGLFQLEPPRPA